MQYMIIWSNLSILQQFLKLFSQTTIVKGKTVFSDFLKNGDYFLTFAQGEFVQKKIRPMFRTQSIYRSIRCKKRLVQIRVKQIEL